MLRREMVDFGALTANAALQKLRHGALAVEGVPDVQCAAKVKLPERRHFGREARITHRPGIGSVKQMQYIVAAGANR